MILKNIVIITIILLIIATIVSYLIRAKKRGEACVGCPYAKKCNTKSGISCSNRSDHCSKNADAPCTVFETHFKVDGMHCEHCKKRVEDAVASISGVSFAVDLDSGKLTAFSSRPIDSDLVKNLVTAAGYSISDIAQ